MQPYTSLRTREVHLHALWSTLCCGMLLAGSPASVSGQEIDLATKQPPLPPLADSCPAGAPDGDGDTLCDAAEALYGTDPAEPDTDGDSLSDADELFGMTFEWAADATTPNTLDLRSLGADPLHRDVFVEIDYYAGHRPEKTTINLAVAAFDAAPTSNPDGQEGIRLHYLIDSEIAVTEDDEFAVLGGEPVSIECPEDRPECDGVAWYAFDIYAEFDPIKSRYADPARHAAFHYALFADRMVDGSSGISFDTNGHDLVVTVEGSTDPLWVAGTFMHELGHNLGLKHGGDEHASTKLNYFSVMNYIYQAGVHRDGARVVDYSRHPVAELVEASIDEQMAMSPGPGTTEAQLERYRVFNNYRSGALPLMGDASMNLDFNENGTIDPAPYALDLDGDGSTDDTVRASQNDWDWLTFDARGSIGSPGSWDAYTSTSYEPSEAPCRGRR